MSTHLSGPLGTAPFAARSSRFMRMNILPPSPLAHTCPGWPAEKRSQGAGWAAKRTGAVYELELTDRWSTFRLLEDSLRDSQRLDHGSAGSWIIMDHGSAWIMDWNWIREVVGRSGADLYKYKRVIKERRPGSLCSHQPSRRAIR